MLTAVCIEPFLKSDSYLIFDNTACSTKRSVHTSNVLDYREAELTQNNLPNFLVAGGFQLYIIHAPAA